jgi:hypothetical protein
MILFSHPLKFFLTIITTRTHFILPANLTDLLFPALTALQVLPCCFVCLFYGIVGLYSILGTVTFSTTLSRLAYNAPAAWRSGGFHYKSCGRQKFNFALNFPRGYCRRCAKPPVKRWHFYERVVLPLHCRVVLRSRYKSLFHYFVRLYSLFDTFDFLLYCRTVAIFESVTLSASLSDYIFLSGRLVISLLCRAVHHCRCGSLFH